MTTPDPTTAAPTVPGPAAPGPAADLVLHPIGVDEAWVTGGFWKARQDANRSVSIPDGLRQLREAKNLHNFEVAAGEVEGEAIGPIFADSDVYKWLEAAAWEYAREPDARLLADQLDVSRIVAGAQDEDGYLDTVVQLRQHERYVNPAHDHEHYCAGHLFQAAVAQSRATGHDDLLRVAVKLADHLVRTFGPGKREDVDGHPVVEMGLVELYRETGTQDYLALASYFVEARGHGLLERYPDANATYLSDRVPVREATTVEGHAVRAVYFAAGAADVAIERGDTDLLVALGRQYADMVATKQYVTGGLGARWEGEAFGDPYELPSDRAYAETCAAIGAVQWAWRMLLATGEVSYADQIERLLYNAFLPGVSLSGGEYFYVNTLHVREGSHADTERSPVHGRRGWFDCACCPPNVMRTLSSLGGYLATTEDSRITLHQYAPAEISTNGLRLRVETEYPWQGRVTVRVLEAPADEREIRLRIPAWADHATVDGIEVPAAGYESVRRVFAADETVVLELPMSVRTVRAADRVDQVHGSVVFERGPLVYAAEQLDQADGVVIDDVRLDPGTDITASFDPDLLGGMVALTAPVTTPDGTATLTLVPYLAWANRQSGQPMRVFIRES